jgi:hypothetical protein
MHMPAHERLLPCKQTFAQMLVALRYVHLLVVLGQCSKVVYTPW